MPVRKASGRNLKEESKMRKGENKMLNLVKTEYIKLHHTFGERLPVIAPVFTLCLVLPWTYGFGDAVFAGVWNWWYTLLLPGMLAVFCYLAMNKDKKINYYHLKAASVPVKKCLMGKMIYASLGLLSANFLVFVGTWLLGSLVGWSVPVMAGFCAIFILSATYLWEIPLYLFLSARFGLFAVAFVCMALHIFTASLLAGSSCWWVLPASIPARLMCPVLGILPNGLAVSAGSHLLRYDVLAPGILLSLLWFVLLAGLTLEWFRRKEMGK